MLNYPMAASNFREWIPGIYFGTDEAACRFRYGMVIFDIATIGLFLVSAFVKERQWVVMLDLVVALALSIEFAARLYAEPVRWRFLRSFTTLADLTVIASLLLPAILDNLAFLRIVRALRLLRSYHLLNDLRSDSAWFREHEDVVQRTVNLAVFVFIVTSVVYVTQHLVNPKISNYVDALYFTITTLTTTGFGDITLQGPGGRVLSIVIMVVGVGLFLRLLQAIFRPNKVRYDCPDCGLLLHEPDAVHCKHCGRVLHIPTEGRG